MFFEVFLLIRDARYGNFIHLPFDCSAMNQPMKTMRVFETIQDVYLEKLQEDMEKAFRT